ncbi:hypothetical protein NLJ89_g7973 [Agrocybe chaxingu]|uniref:Uncharacterized protein n=1 Tax=Agrocybe chaxingu TaxID=84603 RepID=A0A9W8JVR8_9AGAR|nr:hypothetical protein NLJ89_g7973 [Agrocybe chaxingu]
MISAQQRTALLDLCHKFVNCGEEVNLSHLLDLLAQTIHDHESQEWQDWSKYMAELNEAWVLIYKEGEDTAWPEPPPEILQAGPAAMVDAGDVTTLTTVAWHLLSQDVQKTQRAQMRAQRKLELEGGGEIGAARNPKSAEQRRRGGRTRNALADELVFQFKEPNNNGELMPVVYCIACDHRRVGRDTGRIREHGEECKKLPVYFPTLFKQLIEDLAARAHSTKLEGKSNPPPAANFNSYKDGAQEKSRESDTILTYMNPAKISEKHKIHIELTMFRMFICCALPWALMNSEFFINFVVALAPNFVVPDRSSFFPKHLAQEVAVWNLKFKDFLGGKVHLTLSFDGWSSRKKDEIYTFHTTTPKRRSFFTDGYVFNGLSVTGDALLDVTKRLLACYDPLKYSAAAMPTSYLPPGNTIQQAAAMPEREGALFDTAGGANNEPNTTGCGARAVNMVLLIVGGTSDVADGASGF